MASWNPTKNAIRMGEAQRPGDVYDPVVASVKQLGVPFLAQCLEISSHLVKIKKFSGGFPCREIVMDSGFVADEAIPMAFKVYPEGAALVASDGFAHSALRMSRIRTAVTTPALSGLNDTVTDAAIRTVQDLMAFMAKGIESIVLQGILDTVNEVTEKKHNLFHLMTTDNIRFMAAQLIVVGADVYHEFGGAFRNYAKNSYHAAVSEGAKEIASQCSEYFKSTSNGPNLMVVKNSLMPTGTMLFVNHGALGEIYVNETLRANRFADPYAEQSKLGMEIEATGYYNGPALLKSVHKVTLVDVSGRVINSDDLKESPALDSFELVDPSEDGAQYEDFKPTTAPRKLNI
jgi:hypothetical protein